VVALEPGQNTLVAQVLNKVMAATGGCGNETATPESALRRISELVADTLSGVSAAALRPGPESSDCYICRSLKDTPTTAVCAHHPKTDAEDP
jgi:hypothetical protein